MSTLRYTVQSKTLESTAFTGHNSGGERMKTLRILTAAAALAALAGPTAFAGGMCQVCQCQPAVKKVCVPVWTTKKVTKTVWDCKCEDICIPGPKLPHRCTAECGKVRTVRRLIRRTITIEVPVCHWVTKEVCGDCCGLEQSKPGTLAPQPLPKKQ